MDIFNPSTDTIETLIWQNLSRALHDKHHPWRLMSVATVGQEGAHTRMVVLRDVIRHTASEQSGQLIFFTDQRSGKVSDIALNPKVECLFWDSRHQVQLRVKATVQWADSADVIQQYWSRVPRHMYRDYTDANDVELIHSRSNFLVGLLQVHSLDWLMLKREGHQHFLIQYGAKTQVLKLL